MPSAPSSSRTFSLAVGLLLVILCGFPGVMSAENLDQYGGFPSLHTAGTGYFTVTKFGNRWMFVDPIGNAYFGRGADLISDSGQSAWGNIIRYTTIYTYDASNGTYSSNLNVKAEDLFANDVINDKGVTVRAAGDVIYIGHGRPFNQTYFNVSTLGGGGSIQWYYSTGGGRWSLLNGSGKPADAPALNPDETYNLDTGNWIVPDGNGFYSGYAPNGNLVSWWTLNWGHSFFPLDLAPNTLPNDPTPLYYLKGVVTRAFTTAPKVAQIYDETSLYRAAPLKYSAQDGSSYLQNWYIATMQRMRKWGLNLAADYSGRYDQYAPNNPTNRYPVIPTYQLSGDVMEKRYFPDTAVKGLYDGAKCNGQGLYQGVQPDVFDPLYTVNMIADASNHITGSERNDPWTLAINPEEADYLFGLDSNFNHEHMVFVAFGDNPYHPTGTDPFGNGMTYPDSHLYTKYALRDYLRYLYKDASDPLGPFTLDSNVLTYATYTKAPAGLELKALQNLNSAWGTGYTSWDTTGSGDANSSQNAWGSGTGFMDEAGKQNSWGIFQHITNGCRGLYYKDFQTPGSRIATDFGSFLKFFTQKYGSVLRSSLQAITPKTLVVPFIYDPPVPVAQGIAPYVDALAVSPSFDPQNAMQRIMDNFKKPLIYHDYQQANLDSPMDYGGAITAVSWDGINTSISFAGGVPYEMRFAEAPQFPDSSGCPPYPRVVKAQWTTIWVSGNYSGCLHNGQRVHMNTDSSWVGDYFQSDTQALKAQSMVDKYRSFISQPASDGTYFVAGVSHWGWSDFSELDGSEQGQFGLVTQWDNAYDGVEARRAVSVNVNGRFIGGENRDYGDVISTLSAFWTSLNDSRNLPGIGTVSGPQASFIFSPSNPAIGQPVQFTDTSTGGPTSWSWDFGDNGSSHSRNPSHAYTAAGTYTVTLTVSNSIGQSHTSQDVSVSGDAFNSFDTLTPCRVFDTRMTLNGFVGLPLQPYGTRSFNVGGVCGIPADAAAISANLTVTNVGAPGELVVFPADVLRPNTSTISFRAGRTRANNALVSFSKSSATFSVFNNSAATVDLIFDVNGFFR